MITVEQLARCTGSNLVRASSRRDAYVEALAAYDISTPRRVAMLLANVGHESGGFIYSSEIWKPTPQQLRYERNVDAPWPGTAAAATLERCAINRLAYGLGNACDGDGFRYRGRGDLETTGAANYRRLTARLRTRFPDLDVPDFLEEPDKLALARWAALSACDYVDMLACNAQADANSFDHYCDLVNRGRITVALGDSNGWPNRLRLYRVGCGALGIEP